MPENTQNTELSCFDRIILFLRNDEMRNFVAWYVVFFQ